MVVLGAQAIIDPASILTFVRRVWSSSGGFFVAIAVRLALGVLLIVIAPDTHYPTTIRVFGVVTFAAGLLIPVIGRERLDRLVDWWVAQPPVLMRVWGAVACLLGAFLVHATV